jgi:hypothetical protein
VLRGVNMLVKVKCPYCGFEKNNHIEVEADHSIHPVIVRCNIDEGGCDKDFVVFPKIMIIADIRKIEGVGKYEE